MDNKNELYKVLLNPIEKDEILSAIDYLENSALNEVSNNLVENIPFVSYVSKIYKGCQDLKEVNYLTKLACFLLGFNQCKESDEKVYDYQLKLKENEKFRQKELRYIVLILDSIIDNEKAAWLGNLYFSYINNQITWDEFKKYREILEQLIVNDFYELFNDLKTIPDDVQLRLISLGLIKRETTPEIMYKSNGEDLVLDSNAQYMITKAGQKLKDILQKKIFEE